MTREPFHEALQRIEFELLELGELAGSAVQRSVEAVSERELRSGERMERTVRGATMG